ncbi:hypothetical protein [Acidiphilium sp.]|uniref:hypothetical protein n=1 Tax=Acidiphilium sp. TaxID=527 RepID=UPI00258EE8CE|nr:hypothetical protein [Acidiphilium sp.]
MAETIDTPETDTAHADRSPFGPRSSNFERVLWSLDDAAAAPCQSNALRAMARKYLLVERASGEISDDAISSELSETSFNRLGLVSEIPARDFGDVAVKLAVLLVEGDNTSGAAGGTPEQLHRILASALAELVILGEHPLPRMDALRTLTADDLEWHAPEGDGEAEQ